MSRGPLAPPLRAAHAALATPVSIVGAGLAIAMADLLEVRSIDARYVALCAGILSALLMLRLTRRVEGTRRIGRRVLVAVPAIVSLAAALVAPRSPWAVSALSIATLLVAMEAVVHAARTAYAVGERSRPVAVLLALLVAAPPSLLLADLAVVAGPAQLSLAVVRVIYQNPAQDPDERALTLITEDGYHLEATYTPGREGAPAVILTHGLGASRTTFTPWVRPLRRLGYHVIRFDLRANGTSEGAVGAYGQREDRDLRAAIDAVRAMPAVDRTRVAVVGASMGGGVVLATEPTLVERDVRAIVLLAPASRYAPMVSRALGPLEPVLRPGGARVTHAIGERWLADWSPADSLDPRLPTLVFHGALDHKVPLSLSARLADAHPSVTLHILPHVVHDEIMEATASDPSTWRSVENFLTHHLRDDR